MQELKITVKRSHQKAQSSKLNGPSEKNDNFSQYIMQPNQDSIYRASNVTLYALLLRLTENHQVFYKDYVTCEVTALKVSEFLRL